MTRPLFEPEPPRPPAAPSAPRPLFPPEPAQARPPVPAVAPRSLIDDDAAPPDAFQMFAEPRLRDAPPGERRAVLDLGRQILALRMSDVRPFMAFGEAAQARVAAVPDAVLKLVSQPPSAVEAPLRAVREAIGSVGAEELLQPGLVASLLRRVTRPEDRLTTAVAALTAHVVTIGHARPELEDRHRRAVALLAAQEAARRDLSAACLAGEVLVAFLPTARPWLLNDSHNTAAYCLRSLEDRVTSLRVTRLASSGDLQQLTNLRDHYARLLEAASGGVRETVALWKRQCSTALIALRSRDGAALGTAVADLAATGTRLAVAIDGALGAHHGKD